jgi:hypothetical protein
MIPKEKAIELIGKFCGNDCRMQVLKECKNMH